MNILDAIEKSGAFRVHNIAKPETTTFTDAELQVFVDLMCADLVMQTAENIELKESILKWQALTRSATQLVEIHQRTNNRASEIDVVKSDNNFLHTKNMRLDNMLFERDETIEYLNLRVARLVDVINNVVPTLLADDRCATGVTDALQQALSSDNQWMVNYPTTTE